MGLAETFQGVVDSLPDDWTDLELDLRIADESRYVDAAIYLATCNARPTPSTTGTGACWSPTASVTRRRRPPCTARCGCSTTPASRASWCCASSARVASEVTQMWGRPYSVRDEFRRLRAQ